MNEQKLVELFMRFEAGSALSKQEQIMYYDECVKPHLVKYLEHYPHAYLHGFDYMDKHVGGHKQYLKAYGENPSLRFEEFDNCKLEMLHCISFLRNYKPEDICENSYRLKHKAEDETAPKLYIPEGVLIATAVLEDMPLKFYPYSSSIRIDFSDRLNIQEVWHA